MSAETKNVEELRTHLDQDEIIESYVFGAYECTIIGNDTIRDGILAATNKKLVFYAKKNLSYDMKVFPYTNISRIEISKDFMGHEISIFAMGNCIKLKWINSENFSEFVDLINEVCDHERHQ